MANNRTTDCEFTNGQLLDDSSATAAFLELVDQCRKEFYQASKFERDLVSHLNPNCKNPNRLFVWGIIPHDETSYSGMMRVYYKLGANLQFFEMKEDGRCHALQDAILRTIHFCVDQLSARNFRALLKELTKRLTELGGAEKIMPLLEIYQQFTCTHDYFHETDIHRQDVIYRSHYGSFLQAFQCHLKLKGIAGDVAKKVTAGLLIS